MSKAAKSISLGVAMCLLVSSVALATNRKAQGMVASVTKEQAALLASHPDLAKIDGAIRADCAAKINGEPATGDFCGCAAALTMALWRSGADPNMVPRLNEYLKNPTDEAAHSFLQYQGPELYRGVCTEASK